MAGLEVKRDGEHDVGQRQAQQVGVKGADAFAGAGKEDGGQTPETDGRQRGDFTFVGQGDSCL